MGVLTKFAKVICKQMLSKTFLGKVVTIAEGTIIGILLLPVAHTSQHIARFPMILFLSMIPKGY